MAENKKVLTVDGKYIGLPAPMLAEIRERVDECFGNFCELMSMNDILSKAKPGDKFLENKEQIKKCLSQCNVSQTCDSITMRKLNIVNFHAQRHVIEKAEEKQCQIQK